MVGKSQIKLIKSLQQKKYRSKNGLFVVEGYKTVRELLVAGLEVYGVYVTKAGQADLDYGDAQIVPETELVQMSSLRNPDGVLAVFRIPETLPISFSDWIVALDAVRDPGNLGTIIRLCDWFGISHLVCSRDTVDCYNPKCLQATMGSIARVNVVYDDLDVFLEDADLPVFGAYMNGASVYEKELPSKGIWVMGNEAHGVSGAIGLRVGERVAIPQFGAPTAESLNVATATAILLGETRRTKK